MNVYVGVCVCVCVCAALPVLQLLPDQPDAVTGSCSVRQGSSITLDAPPTGKGVYVVGGGRVVW